MVAPHSSVRCVSWESCFRKVLDHSEGAASAGFSTDSFSVSKITLEFGSPNFESVFGAVDFDLFDESASDHAALVEEVSVHLIAESFILEWEHRNILFYTLDKYC